MMKSASTYQVYFFFKGSVANIFKQMNNTQEMTKYSCRVLTDQQFYEYILFLLASKWEWDG